MTLSFGTIMPQAFIEQAEAATCNVQIGKTIRSGNTIIGYGSLSNCPYTSSANLIIQRSRFYGWQDMATVKVTGSKDVYVSYNCSGTGTHDFRTTISGYTVGGKFRFKESNHIKASC
ncbi:hypothetical protein [Nostoc sp.]|uniref:hypothetical protein n=1 Tax=Nostoc sp. TaxID=1180 RepID=UPI002FF507D5